MIEIMVGFAVGVLVLGVYNIMARMRLRRIKREIDGRISKLECPHLRHSWRILPILGLESTCLRCGERRCEATEDGVPRMFEEIKASESCQVYNVYKASKEYFDEAGDIQST